MSQQYRVFDRNGNFLGWIVQSGVGSMVSGTFGGLGCVLLIILVGLLPYVAFLLDPYIGYRIKKYGWNSVSQSFKIITFLASLGWMAFLGWFLYNYGVLIANNLPSSLQQISWYLRNGWTYILVGILLLFLTQLWSLYVVITGYFNNR